MGRVMLRTLFDRWVLLGSLACLLLVLPTAIVWFLYSQGRIGHVLAPLELHHDMGMVIVPAEDPLTAAEKSLRGRFSHVFRVRNPSSSKPWRLELDRISCGCLFASIDPEVVPPAGEAKVTLRYSAQPQPDRRTEYVVVKTDSPKLPKFACLLTVEQLPEITVRMERTPLLDRQQRAEFDMDVLFHSMSPGVPTPFDVTAVDGDATVERVDSIESRRYSATIWRTVGRFRIKLSSQAEASLRDGGQYVVDLLVRCGTAKQERSYVLKMPKAVHVEPQAVYLTTGAGQIRIVTDGPVAIQSVDDSQRLLSYNWQMVEGGKGIQLAVTKRDENFQGLSRTELRIALKKPLETVVTIPVFVVGR